MAKTLDLTSDSITVAQALKLAGLANSGGEAKHLVREGHVKVNAQVENQPGRKLVAGDKFQLEQGELWTIGPVSSHK